MSTQFKNPPGTFAEYENLKSPAPDILRGDHLVVVTIDRLLALQAAFKRWRKRRKTLRALADLDDRQLRDIGLTRDDRHYHALAEHEDVRTDYFGTNARNCMSNSSNALVHACMRQRAQL